MWLSIIMIALLVWGTWLSWKDIEQGTGWVCGFFSAKMLKSLNDKRTCGKDSAGGRAGLYHGGT